jgi:hypothetical protein
VDRRRFLALLAASAAVLGLPGEGEAAVEAVRFDADDADVARAIFRAIYGEGADAVDVVAAVEETLAYLPEDKHDLIRALPMLIDQLSRALVPTFAAWRSLDPAAREAALVDWGTSSIELRRTVYSGLRRILLFHAYMDPVTWPAIGYPGPWLERMTLPVHATRFGDLS